ncbi:MAG TPA: hypothetical protein VKV18_15065 [Chthonomonas sp.]|uniref:hypothetical protein n=1 Tax=Chthonomonas sp. TaxID=2282153 RepID=UPI002B4AF3AF|nr:hypothetical protein [Chthonomonas sp.]HLI49989.1 hypothetical protein [Chthonomonas sp.]
MLVQRYPFRLVQTTHDPEFGMLYEIEGKIEPSQELVRCWLAPGWNYMAVRVEDQILSHPSIEVVYSCTKAERTAGQCVPTRCSMLEGALKHGKLEASFLWEFKNITYSFNDVPDSLFSPQLPVGSIRYDENKQQMWHITPSGTLPDARFGHVQSWHYLFACLFISSLTALVLILSGIFIGWRRKQRGV